MLYDGERRREHYIAVENSWENQYVLVGGGRSGREVRRFPARKGILMACGTI